MLPVIALVGRPNVGKSTLFNRVTRTRDALVADVPGLTRDRKYGDGRVGERPFIVIDTGGLSGETDDLDGMMAQQVWQAIEEADLLFFLVDDVPASRCCWWSTRRMVSTWTVRWRIFMRWVWVRHTRSLLHRGVVLPLSWSSPWRSYRSR
jgi:GTPase involved in cell partitioning and DNA repair